MAGMAGDAATRPIAQVDLPVLLAMNNAAVPDVNRLDEAELARLAGMSAVATVVVLDGRPRGIMLALRPGQPYDSPNYRWFTERYEDFLYVDRVIVAPDKRGAGLGRMLYVEVFDHAAAHGVAWVTCEVNLEPPNPGSLRFHTRLGFARVGEQYTEGGTKRVALLARPVD
jgi:predicted GNAT superfamily acetyltransferase